MLAVSQRFLNAITGSNRPVIQATAWYNGQVTVQTLPIVGGTMTGTDDGDAIRHQLTLDIADEDGALIPHSETDPLAPFGQRINLRAGIDIGGGETESVSLGWFRIQGVDAAESWTYYQRPAGDEVVVSRGGTISLKGMDLGQVVKDARFLAPEQPVETGSTKAEVIRLLWGLGTPLVGSAWPGVTDDVIHADTVTYTEDRWAAVCDLAKHLNAIPYFDQHGDLIFRPQAAGASVWHVAGGDDGVLVDMSVALSRDGVYNMVVARGESSDQLQVGKFAVEQTGAVAWEGSFGHVPTFISSPLITNATEADDAALRELQRQIQTRTFPMQVTCLCNYALQVGDTVTVDTPYGPIDGRVQEANWPLEPGPMTMTVVIPRSSYWNIYGTSVASGTGGFS